VRVLDCNAYGSGSTLIAGIDWVAGNHVQPAVANVSISMGSDNYQCNSICRQLVGFAAAGLVDAGVAVVTSAGNSNNYDYTGKDACDYAPNHRPEVITVAATDSLDGRAKWLSGVPGVPRSSNWGTCVDIWAPGRSVQYASNTGGYGITSGTSFAAPAVAGTLALYLDSSPFLTVQQLTQNLYQRSTWTAIADGGPGTTSRLLYAPDFRIFIGGPSQISENGQYEWQAVPYGGGHHQPTSYLWEYKPVNSGVWQTVGTTQNYTRYVTTADWNFQLRVTAHIHAVSDIDWLDVAIGPPCDPGDPLCPD
jgi:subtilisin family serine protease